MEVDIALILGAYLIGSLPHLSALAKLSGVKLEGDSHISLWRRGGRLVGTIGIIGDFAKGAIPVAVGINLGFELHIIVIAGLAAVSGQMWPIFSKFDGEKGNSIGLAMAGAVATLAMFIALVPIIIGAAIRTVPRLRDSSQPMDKRLKLGGPPSRSLPVGVLIGFLGLPLASWGLGEPRVVTLGFAALFLLIVIRRLTAGLRDDIKANNSIRSVLINRLLYDRGHR